MMKRLWAVGAGLLVFVPLASVCAVLGGCSTPGPLITHQANLRWPQAPAVARVRYVGQIRGSDEGSAVAEAIAGRAEARRELVRPYAAAVTSGNVLVVTDPGNGQLDFFDLHKRTLRRVTHFGKQRLRSPVGVAATRAGAVYVSDSLLAQVFVFDERGKALRRVGDKWQRPTGVAVDRTSGIIYVADTLAHRIQALGSDGRPRFTFGQRGSATGQFNYPTHLAFDQLNGVLLVCDTLNFRIQRFDRSGKSLGTFGAIGDSSGSLSKPKGIAIDSAGHIYVADALFDTIQVFDAQGRLLLYFGRPGRGPGQLAMPTGLAIDARDRIFVANTLNRRIEVFQYLGRIAP